MFWRLWWRAVSVKRSQAALALGSLAVGAAITSMLLNLYGDVRRKMTEDFRSYGANVVIAPASTGTAGDAEGSAMVEESALQPLAQFARADTRHVVRARSLRRGSSVARSRRSPLAGICQCGGGRGGVRRAAPFEPGLA